MFVSSVFQTPGGILAADTSHLSFLKRDLAVNVNNLFKLGQEGKYRVYQNQYSTNTLALNKHQHREDYDKKRHLSHKFSLTTASEFKWNGSIHGSRSLTVATLRLTIIQLETSIPGPFMHPNWASHRYSGFHLDGKIKGLPCILCNPTRCFWLFVLGPTGTKLCRCAARPESLLWPWLSWSVQLNQWLCCLYGKILSATQGEQGTRLSFVCFVFPDSFLLPA